MCLVTVKDDIHPMRLYNHAAWIVWMDRGVGEREGEAVGDQHTDVIPDQWTSDGGNQGPLVL